MILGPGLLPGTLRLRKRFRMVCEVIAEDAAGNIHVVSRGLSEDAAMALVAEIQTGMLGGTRP